MVLHLPHTEGGFGVTFNDVTKDSVFYTTTSHLVVPLSLPQFNRLVETSFVRDESSASNADVTVIPSQDRVTQQILSH